MSTFAIGDKVEWRPQGSIIAPVKQGTVIAVIPPYKTPTGYLEPLRGEYVLSRLECQLSVHIKKRSATSYLIAVESGKTKPVIFWPYQSKLQKLTK